jgi:SAM-dependent methyltransferase
VSGYKELLVEELFEEFGGEPARVLDLGCGTCGPFATALRRHPNVSYTGVELHAPSLAKARAAIGGLPNVRLHEGSGEEFAGDAFDLVVSISVLEHVKHLREFLAVSVRAAKPGGRIVHRYDLGHALTPSSVGERLRVAVARRAPALVRTARFTTYPDLDAITALLAELGVEGIDVVQAQVPGLKGAMNVLDPGSPADRELAEQIVALEARLWEQVGPRLSADRRDRTFPSVMVSGHRRASGAAEAVPLAAMHA